MRELGAELARDYAGREPLLVGSLKACVPFVTDLSHGDADRPRASTSSSSPGYGHAPSMGGHEQIRFLKDLDTEIGGPRRRDRRRGRRHRAHAPLPLPHALAPRARSRSSCATLFDRPYRRLVDDLPIRYVGFTVPDEFFAGYGFDLDERWRNLPDLHLISEV